LIGSYGKPTKVLVSTSAHNRLSESLFLEKRGHIPPYMKGKDILEVFKRCLLQMIISRPQSAINDRQRFGRKNQRQQPKNVLNLDRAVLFAAGRIDDLIMLSPLRG